MTVHDVVATVNMRVTLADGVAEDGLRTVLREAPELVGLQEWGHDRDHILVKLCKASLFNFGRGESGGPVMWNVSRYSPVRAVRAVTLVGEGFVGRLPGRKSTLPPSVATLAVFEDEVLGGEVAFINAHLTAEVQDRYGEYHHDKAHRLRVRRHRAEVRALRRLVRRQQRKGRWVYVVLDGNFDGLALPPLESCWANHHGGTLGSRAVDIVFAPQKATQVQVIRSKSDHRHVVATYNRKEK